jgi:hypothetical protein
VKIDTIFWGKVWGVNCIFKQASVFPNLSPIPPIPAYQYWMSMILRGGESIIGPANHSNPPTIHLWLPRYYHHTMHHLFFKMGMAGARGWIKYKDTHDVYFSTLLEIGRKIPQIYLCDWVQTDFSRIFTEKSVYV